jgi:hypothetical protein
MAPPYFARRSAALVAMAAGAALLAIGGCASPDERTYVVPVDGKAVLFEARKGVDRIWLSPGEAHGLLDVARGSGGYAVRATLGTEFSAATEPPGARERMIAAIDAEMARICGRAFKGKSVAATPPHLYRASYDCG